jgi:transposase
VRSDYYAGTTWGRKGQTPVVQRYRLTMLSAVNRRGRMRFMIEKKGLNADVVCRFPDRLMAGASKPVLLIWDGHPMHRSRKVAEAVKRWEGRLRVSVLPGYSPELNPDEGVWREVKAHRLGRAGIFTFDDMKCKALGALRHLAKRPGKIRSFFRTRTTAYAAWSHV